MTENIKSTPLAEELTALDKLTVDALASVGEVLAKMEDAEDDDEVKAVLATAAVTGLLALVHAVRGAGFAVSVAITGVRKAIDANTKARKDGAE